jgi:hypothetical protein
MRWTASIAPLPTLEARPRGPGTLDVVGRLPTRPFLTTHWPALLGCGFGQSRSRYMTAVLVVGTPRLPPHISSSPQRDSLIPNVFQLECGVLPVPHHQAPPPLVLQAHLDAAQQRLDGAHHACLRVHVVSSLQRPAFSGTEPCLSGTVCCDLFHVEAR